MSGLFQLGDFTLHSGQRSQWKIECDALDEGDWRALATMLAQALAARYMTFGRVEGVPRGGLRLAEAMQRYCIPDEKITLLVDDVYTTGRSLLDYRAALSNETAGNGVHGAVVFARHKAPNWVTALFQMPDLDGTPHTGDNAAIDRDAKE